jgi:DNA-binding MarR family transcriptional regulator
LENHTVANHTEALQTVADVLGILTKGDERMPALRARILLEIAIQPGIGMSDLEEKTGLHHSNVGRNLAAMSEYERMGVPGTNLITRVPDPASGNRTLCFLTTKGRKLVEAALARITGKATPFETVTAQEFVREMHQRAGE